MVVFLVIRVAFQEPAIALLVAARRLPEDARVAALPQDLAVTARFPGSSSRILWGVLRLEPGPIAGPESAE